jgi:hypothetical protein
MHSQRVIEIVADKKSIIAVQNFFVFSQKKIIIIIDRAGKIL